MGTLQTIHHVRVFYMLHLHIWIAPLGKRGKGMIRDHSNHICWFESRKQSFATQQCLANEIKYINDTSKPNEQQAISIWKSWFAFKSQQVWSWLIRNSRTPKIAHPDKTHTHSPATIMKSDGKTNILRSAHKLRSNNNQPKLADRSACWVLRPPIMKIHRKVAVHFLAGIHVVCRL